MQSYGKEHPHDWYRSIAALCYAYNTDVPRTMATTPLAAFLSRPSRDIALAPQVANGTAPIISALAPPCDMAERGKN